MDGLRVFFLTVNSLGAALTAVGLFAALSKVGGRFARIVASLVSFFYKVTAVVSRVFRPKLSPNVATVEGRSLAVKASTHGTIQMVFGPPHSTAPLENRIAALEEQIRREQQIRNDEEESIANRHEELGRAIGDMSESAREALIDIAANMSQRIDQQARDGLGVAASGALLIFAGGFGDAMLALSEALRP